MKMFLAALLLFFLSLQPSAQEAAVPAVPAAENGKNGSFTPNPGVEIADIGPEDQGSSTESPAVRIEKARIPSGRDKVNTEIFYPSSGSNWPIVVLLHGSHPKRTDAYYDVMALDLAMHGYLCIFPHYFERNKKGRGVRSEWMKTIGHAIDYAQQIQGTDRERVALVGYSLGAFLSLGYAPTDKRVDCVVAFYGGLSGCYNEAAAEHMPPTLLIHGMKDRTVPARRSLEAFKTLRESRKPVSVLIYPDVGHGFTLHKRGEWDDAVSEDSWNRTLAFLDYNLNFPAWTPEIPAPGSHEAQLAAAPPQAPGPDDPFQRKKLSTPYLDNVWDAGEKLYIDPTGEEYSKVLKDSQPPPRKKSPAKKKSSSSKAAPAKSTTATTTTTTTTTGAATKK